MKLEKEKLTRFECTEGSRAGRPKVNLCQIRTLSKRLEPVTVSDCNYEVDAQFYPSSRLGFPTGPMYQYLDEFTTTNRNIDGFVMREWSNDRGTLDFEGPPTSHPRARRI